MIPEFIVPGRVTQLLHNQTGLAIKGILAAEAGIAVTSVPFHLGPMEVRAIDRLSAVASAMVSARGGERN